MISYTNRLTVPEVSCYSRQQVAGGVIVRYLVRHPGETEWLAVEAFRPTEPVASEQEVR